MKNHRTAITVTLAGLLLATAFAGASARAAVLDQDCVRSARQTRRACTLGCVVAGNCAMEGRVGRAECVAGTVAGAERQSCFARCQQERDACRAEVKACKAQCARDFETAVAECAVGH